MVQPAENQKSFFQKFTATFFDHPAWALFWFVAASVVLWTLQSSLLQNILALDVIETIVWGAQGQMGHFKHPPMSGWIGYAFSWMSGHHDWSMYLLAQLCLALGVFYVYKLAREFFPEREAAAAALLLYLLPYYDPSPMKFCSHSLQIAFQPVMAYYFWRGLKCDRILDWILLGIVSAIAILAKYSAGMILFAGFLYMLFSGPENRKKILHAGPWLAGIVMIVLLIPHIQWLAQHDFASIHHLGTRVNAPHGTKLLPLLAFGCALFPFLPELAGLFLALFPWRQEKIKHPVNREAFRYALYMTAVPCAIFCGITLTGHEIVLMWFSFLASFTGIIAVAVYPLAITRTGYKRLYCIVCTLTVVVFIGTTIDFFIRPGLKIHTKPQELVGIAVDYYRTQTGSERIPAIIGERWHAGVIENYSAHRPPSSPIADPCNVDLLSSKVHAEGALLIAKYEADIRHFCEEYGLPSPKIEIRQIRYQTLLGKKKSSPVCLSFLPPGTNLKKAQSK